jgi:hypothetical protein
MYQMRTNKGPFDKDYEPVEDFSFKEAVFTDKAIEDEATRTFLQSMLS